MDDSTRVLQPLAHSLRRVRMVVWAVLVGATLWFASSAMSFVAREHSDENLGTANPQSTQSDVASGSGNRDVPSSSAALSGIDEHAFQAKLWVPRPRPPEIVQVKAVPPPPAPPFKLRLVSIEQDASGNHAVRVFDPEALRVIRAETGATIGRYLVEKISSSEAVFTDHQTFGRPQHTLRLRTTASSKTPFKIIGSSGPAGGAP